MGIPANLAAAILTASLVIGSTGPHEVITHRHRDRLIPSGSVRKRERHGSADATPKLVNHEPPTLKIVKPQSIITEPMARLVRLRFTRQGASADARTLPNGNVVLCVPTRLRGAQRRAAVRLALRQSKLAEQAS